MNVPCIETDTDERRIHSWHRTGLDIIAGVLCNTRRCVWCGRRQLKPYGGRGSWHDQKKVV